MRESKRGLAKTSAHLPDGGSLTKTTTKRMDTMNDLIRFQIEMNVDQMRDLERLMALCGLRTKRELFNNALTLLKWAVKEKAKGSSILAMNDANNSFLELEMPCLEAVVAREASSKLDDKGDKLEQKPSLAKSSIPPH